MSSMTEVSVSIIVPVYNAERHLVECLDSLVNQTFRDIEILLVNDGSTDSSGILCDEYAAKDQRITVIHQKNGGQTQARTAGLAVAQGTYVHFVDSDDWLDSTMEEKMYALATEHDADIVTCDTIFHKGQMQIDARQAYKAGVYTKQDLIESVYPTMIYSGRFFYFGMYAAMWNKLFRRSLVTPHIESVDPSVKIGEDGLTTFASFLDANTVVVTDDILYHYRDDNSTSLTRSYCWEQFDSALLLIAYLRRIAKRHEYVKNLGYQIDMYLLYNVKSIILEEFYYKIKKPYRHRYQYLKRIVTHPTVQEVCERIDTKEFEGKDAKFFELLQSHQFKLLLGLSVSQSIDQRTRHYIRKIAYTTKTTGTAYGLASQAKELAGTIVTKSAAPSPKKQREQ